MVKQIMSGSVNTKNQKKDRPKNKKKLQQKRAIPKRSSGQKRVFWGCFALLLVVFLVVLGKALNFLNSPAGVLLSSADKKNYTYTGDSTINLVIKADSIYTLFLNPNEKVATILKIPDDTYLNLAYGFGRYPARSIYELGQAESTPMGAKLLKHTLSDLEGIAVDGIILARSQSEMRSPVKLIEEIKQNPVSMISLVSKLDSDLSRLELFRLFWELRGIRSDNLRLVDLGTSTITRSALLADGTRVLGIDQVKLDNLIQSKFKDLKVEDEGLSIGVFNGTDHSKLAEAVARIINHMGGRVIFVTNSQQSYPQSFVFGKKGYTTVRLTQIFAPRCLKTPFVFSRFQKANCDIKDPEILSSRAQVNVVLGEDFYTNQTVK